MAIVGHFHVKHTTSHRVVGARCAKLGELLHLRGNSLEPDVRIPIGRHGKRPVPQDLLHHLQVYAVFAQPRTGRVPEAVEVEAMALSVVLGKLGIGKILAKKLSTAAEVEQRTAWPGAGDQSSKLAGERSPNGHAMPSAVLLVTRLNGDNR